MMRALSILPALGLIAGVSCSQGDGGGSPAATPLLADAAITFATAKEQSYTRSTPFVPLDNPLFLTAQEESYLLADDLVLGLEWEGEARAYPVRMLRFHHLVNDTVTGRPMLITY